MLQMKPRCDALSHTVEGVSMRSRGWSERRAAALCCSSAIGRLLRVAGLAVVAPRLDGALAQQRIISVQKINPGGVFGLTAPTDTQGAGDCEFSHLPGNEEARQVFRLDEWQLDLVNGGAAGVPALSAANEFNV